MNPLVSNEPVTDTNRIMILIKNAHRYCPDTVLTLIAEKLTNNESTSRDFLLNLEFDHFTTRSIDQFIKIGKEQYLYDE